MIGPKNIHMDRPQHLERNLISLTRINDNQYYCKLKNKEAIITVPKDKGNVEFQRNLAKEVAKSILLNKKNYLSKTIRLAGKDWSMAEGERASRAMKVASKVSSFIHTHGESNILRVNVSEIEPIAVIDISSAMIAVQHSAQFDETIKYTNFQSFKSEANKNQSRITAQEYSDLVRGKLPLFEEEEEKLNLSRFSDPFTSLASLAFQRYEKEFTSKDNFVPQNCEYVIVKDHNELKLVHKSNKVLNNPKSNKKTIELYKNFLIKEYGKEKIKYIEHAYNIDLSKAESLTPEHIYRFNIGVNNLESYDLNNMLKKINKLERSLNELSEKELTTPLEEVMEIQDLFSKFTLNEFRGITRAISQESSPTLNDLLKWISHLGLTSNKAADLSPKQLNALMKIYELTPDEKDAALTGRKIYEHIGSGYTTAELNEYKPWIDQHELFQIFPALEKSRSPVEYHEKLAHVVCKVHLAKEHPVDGYRVGSIIPALKDENGEPRWYKVTSCISNGEGILSYTLESVCDDPSLPAIKLFRSTASSPYALQSTATVLNDLNTLNSPGYQGMGLADQYEQPFFQKRTIPTWVGYTMLAQKELTNPYLDEKQLEAVFEDLSSANIELHIEHQSKFKKKSMRDILKSHDAVLNELRLSNEAYWGRIKFVGSMKTGVSSNFSGVTDSLIKKYLKDKNYGSHYSPELLKTEERDAEKLLEELNKLPLSNYDEKMKIRIKRFKKELNEHVISSYYTNVSKKIQEQEFKDSISDSVNKLKNDTKRLLKKGRLQDARKKMKDWANVLSKHADSLGENIQNKKAVDVNFTGHSLGGACAQSHVVHLMSEPRRIPLPGHKCEVFLFDDPAINDSDNIAFKKFGEANESLFQRFGVTFAITRRQEAGDIVPLGGETHLGAADSPAEAEKLNRWLKFDAAVNERLPNASDKTIAESKTAHATQFEQGTVGRDYIKSEYTALTQGKFDKQVKTQGDPWKLPSLIGSTRAEKIRSNPGLFLDTMRMYIRSAKTEDRTAFYHDENGVFVVSEEKNPISSKKKDKK